MHSLARSPKCNRVHTVVYEVCIAREDKKKLIGINSAMDRKGMSTILYGEERRGEVTTNGGLDAGFTLSVP